MIELILSIVGGLVIAGFMLWAGFTIHDLRRELDSAGGRITALYKAINDKEKALMEHTHTKIAPVRARLNALEAGHRAPPRTTPPEAG